MVRCPTMNTLVLPVGTVLGEAEGDKRSYGWNLAILLHETLYQLQVAVTAKLHAREGHALQVLLEKKGNLEQISLQHDDLLAHNQGLEQAMEEVCCSVPELAVPVELPTTEKIHHMVVRFCEAPKEATEAQWELNLQIMKLRISTQPTTPPKVREKHQREIQVGWEVI